MVYTRGHFRSGIVIRWGDCILLVGHRGISKQTSDVFLKGHLKITFLEKERGKKNGELRKIENYKREPSMIKSLNHSSFVPSPSPLPPFRPFLPPPHLPFGLSSPLFIAPDSLPSFPPFPPSLNSLRCQYKYISIN